MKEVFKKWNEVKNHPQGKQVLEAHEGIKIFNYIVSEYFKQGEEEETGMTKIYCHDLFKELGMSQTDFYNPKFDDVDFQFFSFYFLDCSQVVLEMLDDCKVLFLLSVPNISNPYYTIAFTPIEEELIYFDYKITDEYE